MRDNGRENVGDRFTDKQPPAGEHLDEHDAERLDVRASIDRLPACLFR
jgi:hypothetical protein